jgi:hypothetical protein
VEFQAVEFHAVLFQPVEFHAVLFQAVEFHAVLFHAVEFQAAPFHAVEFHAVLFHGAFCQTAPSPPVGRPAEASEPWEACAEPEPSEVPRPLLAVGAVDALSSARMSSSPAP